MSHRHVLSIRSCKLHIKLLWQRFKYAHSVMIDITIRYKPTFKQRSI